MRRKTSQSKQSSTERPSESLFSWDNTDQSFVYEEATGKTVDFIRYADRSTGWPAFEIRFTDGTFFFIEPVPQVQFRVRYLKTQSGNIKTLRDYGVVPE